MQNTFNWKLYFILLAVLVVVIAASMPYAFTLAGETLKQANISMPLLIITSLIQSTLLFAAALFFGMKLAGKVGLGLPILESYFDNNKAPLSVKPILKTSILLGIAAGVAIILFDFLFNKLGVDISFWTGQLPPFWMGLLASFYGGIGEEILLRLFFMSLLVWLFSKLARSEEPAVNRNWLVWTAIIISTILFGLGHLPITSTMTELTPLVVVRAIVLNGIGGLVFGWLYWKRGLESAMIAHFSADLALHVFFPLLSMVIL